MKEHPLPRDAVADGFRGRVSYCDFLREKYGDALVVNNGLVWACEFKIREVKQ